MSVSKIPALYSYDWYMQDCIVEYVKVAWLELKRMSCIEINPPFYIIIFVSLFCKQFTAKFNIGSASRLLDVIFCAVIFRKTLLSWFWVQWYISNFSPQVYIHYNWFDRIMPFYYDWLVIFFFSPTILKERHCEFDWTCPITDFNGVLKM